MVKTDLRTGVQESGRTAMQGIRCSAQCPGKSALRRRHAESSEGCVRVVWGSRVRDRALGVALGVRSAFVHTYLVVIRCVRVRLQTRV